MRNFLKALAPKLSTKMPSETVDSAKFSGAQLYTIKAGFGKKVQKLLKALILPKSCAKMPSEIVDSGEISGDHFIKTTLGEKSYKKVEDLVKELSVKFSEEKLFNLLFSFAARLEALVHGKNSDGTLKEKEENSKDKIQTFLAVSKCFPERDLRIFDYWIKIIKMETQKSQKPIFGVAIYKEKYDRHRWEGSKEQTFKLSMENYKILKQLNDQKFSIYETSNLQRVAFNWGYNPRIIPRGKISQIFGNLLNQILTVFHFNWKINDNFYKNKKCEYAMFFQNIWENLMKMMSGKGIDPKLHLNSQDKEIQEYFQKDVEESCKIFENEEAKIIFLNNVHYELAINFELNQRKDIYDRVDDLLSKWVGDISTTNFYLSPAKIRKFTLMIDLSFFYSAKMAIVFILMLLLSTTLEAQRNENDKFFEFMTTIGEHFRGEFNDAEKALELDLDGANSFLKELHTFATSEIVKKDENGEFECKETKKPFIKAIKDIVGEKPDKNMRNFLEALAPKLSTKKPSETVDSANFSRAQLYTIKAGFGKKVRKLLKALILPKSCAKMPSEIVDSVEISGDHLYIIKTTLGEKSYKKVEDLVNELSVKFSEKKLFNLLFSLAARMEALVHGKNIDGTLKKKEEISKDKIQTFLAVSKCFILPEWELRIFDYWIKIIKMKTQKSQNPIYGVAIYKEKYDNEYKSESSKKEAFELSQENYKILKQLNDQKFSIYESSNLLRIAFNWGYNPSPRIPKGKIPQIFENLLNQIQSVFCFNWGINGHFYKNNKCKYAMFFQNVSKSLMKMMSDKGIDPEMHLDSQDKEIREKVQKDVEESCKKFENEEAKNIFLNNVHYELAINFEFNQRKDVYDRVEDLLSNWVGGNSTTNINCILQFSVKESYLKKNAKFMLRKIKEFTLKTNRQSISIIEALIGKEFNFVSLFNQIKTLVEVAIPEEEANLEKAKKEINKKQLENEIESLKTNPQRIAEEKYQKSVAIICTIKQFGEKVKKLKFKIKTIEIKEQLNELWSRIQNNEKKYVGPELWKQTKEFCKIQQIEMEEIVFEEIILKNLQFEFDEIWKNIVRGWREIEEYYLSIPLMQLTEKARTLAKTFGKMLQNVKEHYASQ